MKHITARICRCWIDCTAKKKQKTKTTDYKSFVRSIQKKEKGERTNLVAQGSLAVVTALQGALETIYATHFSDFCMIFAKNNVKLHKFMQTSKKGGKG